MALISAEYLLLGTIAVIGTTAGTVAIRDSVVERQAEVANAIGSIDPSYSYPGLKCGSAWVAGSSYQARKHTPVTVELTNGSGGATAASQHHSHSIP